MVRHILTIVILLSVLLIGVGCGVTGVTDGDQLNDLPASNGPPVATKAQAEIQVPTEITEQAFDCAAVTEIPAVECQALVAFYQATNGPNWVENGDWLATATPCSWLGLTCADGHVDSVAIFFNGLQGQLPAASADLGYLRLLDLHNNAISGPIPAEIGQMADLADLDLSWNQLTGPIPAELTGLPNLQRLSLADNELGGPVPAEIGRLASLRNVDLSRNQLSGPLPEALADLSVLETLRLSDNQLDGSIAFGLGEIPTLSEADLSFNQLTGSAPSALFEVPLHMLWGNQLDGTIFAGDSGQQVVNYLGASFSFDSDTADSVWPELVTAREPSEGPGLTWVPPEHIVFTLVSDNGPQDHNPMGLYVPAEAQIQIYPAAGLNAEVQPIVADLQQLLAEKSDLANFGTMAPEMDAGDPQLPMLPPSNAAQVFQSQAEYIDFAEGSGVRYLTMLSQGPVPVNNDDLFYTFQGLTDDGATYVAVYFPVSLPDLPDSQQIDEAEFMALMEDWPGYLEQTVAMLDEQTAEAFTPDLVTIDALVNSLSVAGMIPPPAIEGEGIWPNDGDSVDAQPVLQWSAVPGAAHYEVVVLDDEAFPPQVAFEQITTETVAPVNPALDPGHYSWTVRALDEDDAVLAELNYTFLVKDSIRLVHPSAGETVDLSPILEWESYPGAVRYQVIVIDDDAYPPAVVFDLATSEASLTLPGPLEPSSYSWTVWAFDGNDTVVAELNSSFLVTDSS